MTVGVKFLDQCREVMAEPQARNELRGWALLAIGALALAGLFAVLLALSRTPGIENLFPWPLGFFKKGLVIHVIFSFVVWFIAVQGGLTALSTRMMHDERVPGSWLGRVALVLAWGSAPLLFIPAFLDRGEASLNNYVPVIIDPLYYAGLAVLATAMVLVFMRFVISFVTAKPSTNGAERDLRLTALAGGISFVLALGAVVLAAWHLTGEAVSPAYNEDLFWAAGHILQLGNGIWLLAAWSLLAFFCVPPKPVDEGMTWSQPISSFSWILIIGAVGAIGFFWLDEPFSMAWRDDYTDLQYLFGPVMALGGLRALTRPRAWASLAGGTRHLAGDTAALCLLTSLLVFGFGGALGLAVDGLDTRTPAHYHAIIGGINLALIGLFLTFVCPILAAPAVGQRTVVWMIGLYTGGQILQSAGLYLAGGAGAPRKTAGADQGLQSTAEFVGMALNGVGGLIAIIGGIMFIWVVGSRLIGSSDAQALPVEPRTPT